MLRRPPSRAQRERERALRNLEPDRVADLEPELVLLIASHLDAVHLPRMPQVCSSFREVITANSNRLWASLLRANYPRAFDIIGPVAWWDLGRARVAWDYPC